MTQIVWDDVGQRLFETGVDRGVLYLLDRSGVPWNGLVSVSEGGEQETTPLYLDGFKYHDSVSLGAFTASIEALTYPDEFDAYSGYGVFGNGLNFDDQRPKPFGFAYRTRVGNDILGTENGYKLHVVFNALATPNTKMFQTLNDSVAPNTFSWSIRAIPESVPGFRPTAHIVFDSTEMIPGLLAYIESILYGTSTVAPRLPTLAELVSLADLWDDVFIVNNGDGTWTATGDSHLIKMLNTTTFEITSPNAVIVDANSYTLDTYET